MARDRSPNTFPKPEGTSHNVKTFVIELIGIWDTLLIFALVLLVIACEWIGRKLIRLA